MSTDTRAHGKWLTGARAGGNFIDHCMGTDEVAFGPNELRDFERGIDQNGINEHISMTCPNHKKAKVSIVAKQIYRFLTAIELENRVAVCNPRRRAYPLKLFDRNVRGQLSTGSGMRHLLGSRNQLPRHLFRISIKR